MLHKVLCDKVQSEGFKAYMLCKLHLSYLLM